MKFLHISSMVSRHETVGSPQPPSISKEAVVIVVIDLIVIHVISLQCFHRNNFQSRN